MRITLFAVLVSAFAAAVTSPARADHHDEKAKAPATAPAAKGKDKEVTLKGTMACAKCAHGEGEKCQNVLSVKEGGKDVKYYLAPNDVSEKNHEEVCSGPKKAKVKGAVKTEKGKKLLTASEIKWE